MSMPPVVGPRPVDEAQPRAVQAGAYGPGQEQVVRGHKVYQGEEIYKDIRQRHAHQRHEHEARTELLPGEGEERDVDNDAHHAHGRTGEQVYDRRYAGDAARDDVVRVKEELEAHSVGGRSEYNEPPLTRDVPGAALWHDLSLH